MAVKYTAAEIAWLRDNWRIGTVDDTVRAFEREFGRAPSVSGICTKASALGLRKDSTLARREWTPERAEWFVSYVPGHSEREIVAEHERVFGWPMTDRQVANGKVKYGVKSGTFGGRFEKGRASSNKGRKWDDFMSPEGQEACRRTQFKKGQVSGNALSRWQPVGSERVNKDGYVEVKVSEGLQRKPNCNFRMKHHVVYEQHHGAIPDGCNVVFADHDKRNFDPGNLVAVPRDLWGVITHGGMQYHDRESLEACMNLATLKRALFDARCGERACHECGAKFKPRYPDQRRCDGCLDARGKIPQVR